MGSGIFPCDADTLWNIRDRSGLTGEASGLTGEAIIMYIILFSYLVYQRLGLEDHWPLALYYWHILWDHFHVFITPYWICSCFIIRCIVHTYIFGHYNPSVRIINLVSLTSLMLCVLIFIHKSQYLYCRSQFKVDSERQIFWETFHGNFYLLSEEFLPEICWEKIAEDILFVFCFDIWPWARTLALRLISQHTTY